MLLCRLSGRNEITLGFALDGRKYQELEDAIGLFAKYVPLQVQAEGQSRFADVIRQVTNSAKDASNWQDGFAWSQIEGSTDSAGPTLPLAFEYSQLSSSSQPGGVRFTIVQQYVCAGAVSAEAVGGAAWGWVADGVALRCFAICAGRGRAHGGIFSNLVDGGAGESRNPGQPSAAAQPVRTSAVAWRLESHRI